MRTIRIFAMILAVTMLFSAGIQADDTGKCAVTEAKNEKEAVSAGLTEKQAAEKYNVAQLVIENMNASKIKEISAILSKVKGVEAIKVDKEAKSLMVTHNAKLNFKKEAMPTITKAVKGVHLQGVEPTKAPVKGKCAGCPSKGKCGSAAKTTKTGEVKTSCGGK